MPQASIKQVVKKARGYNPRIDTGVVESAYDFARRAHQGQFRASGEPYISHPLAVADILCDLRLDQASIVTALLHDVVEDTGIGLDELESRFSPEVARLVDGVTKLTRIEMQSDNRQAENFRKLVLAMSEDIRVLIVKLADRLHNMRTIGYVSEDGKRERIARETLDIFAPLAERIGITDFQHELEDRAFEVIRGDARDTILSRIGKLTRATGSGVRNICTELEKLLKKNGLEAEVSGRRKTPYSIWKKMQSQKVEMESLADIMAFRVIVDSEEDCYRALGIIHRHFKVVMGRIKDYISTPKRNGYQSLHTGVIGPLRQKIEIQIRTHAMHEIAERGVASHWLYKEGGEAVAEAKTKTKTRGGRRNGRDGSNNGDARVDTAGDSLTGEAGRIKWLDDLVQILDHAQSPDEFLEHTQMEMYADQVFCFTPKGALIALPKNSTTVDFAYAVHSDIGNSCVAAKVNGKTRQLATILRNGDQVEIITGRGANPNPAWESFVQTGRAKSLIRRYIRQERQQEFSRLGRALLLKTFRRRGHKFDKNMLAPALEKFGLGDEAALYARIGENRIDPDEVCLLVYPEKDGRQSPAPAAAPAAATTKPAEKGVRRSSREPPVNIKGLIPGMAVHIGTCCHPLPGERIIGIITSGKGLTVHRVDCRNLEKFHSMPELWVDIAWEREVADVSVARIDMVLANNPGSLASVAGQISRNKGNITNVQLLSREVDFFRFMFEIEVGNIRHLTEIIAALRANEAVESVERAKT